MMEVNENEFTIDGKTYISKLSTADKGCKGCIFDNPAGCSKPEDRPSCLAELRGDHNEVIFTEKSKIENINESKFEYNGKIYIAKKINLKTKNTCAKCAFFNKECVNLLNDNKIPPCCDDERKDHHDVFFVEESKLETEKFVEKENKEKINKSLKNNNMQNYIEKIKNLIIPSVNNDFVFTMDGKLGLKNNEKIISYDKDTKEFTEYPEDFGIEVPVFEMSTPANQVKEGDIIKHNTSWVIVKSVNNDSISVLSFTGTSKKVQVIKNFLLGQKLVRKIVSFDFQGNNNMNSMMMLALMDGKSNDDTLKTMLMMQMIQGNNQGFNPMMMLMLDKSTNMKDLLMINMLNGVQLPFFNNQNTTTKK